MQICVRAPLDEDSYLRGLEIGLRTALCCETSTDIEKCLDQVMAARLLTPVNGEAEWQSWMVELEMQSWGRVTNE